MYQLDGPAPDSAAMAEEQEKPDRLYRAESMPGLSEKPKRSLLQVFIPRIKFVVSIN